MESVAEEMCDILNAGSFAAGYMRCDIVVNGSMVSNINIIVDFGDHSHIQTIVESSGELTIHHAIKYGLKIIESRVDNEIDTAAKYGGVYSTRTCLLRADICI